MASTSTASDRDTRSGADGSDQPTRARSRQLSESSLAKAFIAPSIVLMAIVALFPILYALFLSFFAYEGRRREGFAGLGNYIDAFREPDFWDSILATLTFTVFSISFEFLIGLGFALLMNQAFRGRGLTRGAILVPWVIPTVISAQMWYFMFNLTPGFVNAYLPFVPNDFNWLGQPVWPMVTIIFADVWKTAPFVALLLLAGLQTIPEDVYEAGRVDGATAWQRFTQITLPLLKPAILVAMLFRTVDSLRVYDLPKVMTNGTFGTETLSILVQQYIVGTPNPGFGAALSTLTFLLVLGVGILFVSRLGTDVVLGTEE